MSISDWIQDKITDEFDAIFKPIDEWVEEYKGEPDYWMDYSYVMWEGMRINESVAKLMESDYAGISIPEHLRDRFSAFLIEFLKWSDEFECAMVPQMGSMPDGYLDSLAVTEEEEQIELSEIRDRVKSRIIRLFFRRALSWYVENNREFCLRGNPRKDDYILMYVYMPQSACYRIPEENYREAYKDWIIDYCETHDESE